MNPVLAFFLGVFTVPVLAAGYVWWLYLGLPKSKVWPK